MMSIRNILTIAKFEAKVLWRNWFFRILAIVGIFFMTVFNLAAFSAISDGRQFMISSSWGAPYASMVLISIGQAAAVIFLATGSILKNKKVDTNEVFFVRPISNLDYVFGKALSIFKLFFWLHVVFLAIILLVNITNPLTDLNPLAFVIYPLLTSLPSIVFTTGISFMLVTLIRNQPISIVLLLGVAGVILIYFHGKYYHILDFMAFRLNLMASDMIGFSNIESILLHRSFYLVAGIAFLFGSSFFMDRLPNKKSIRFAVGMVGLVIAAGAAFLFTSLWNRQQGIEIQRQEMIAVNDVWTEIPNIDIQSNYIQLTHAQNEISCSASLTIKNKTGKSITGIYFTLNPALKVSEVLIDGQKVAFERTLHVLSVAKDQTFSPEQEAEVNITYQGGIDERVAHLEVDQKRYEEIHDRFLYAVEKRYGFLQADYVLLTNDLLWYPDTQIGYSRKAPIKQRSNFIDFKLDVTVSGGNTAISQGSLEKVGEDLFKFQPEYSLPQLSLAIGNYEKKSINVDSVEYSIYHYPGHDYFVPYFDQLEDTLSVLVTDLVNSYQHDLKLKYPFNQLQLVETPMHYFAYDKIYQGNQAYVQPEMILLPEKGGEPRDLDFKRQFRNMDRQAREQNKVMEDKEKQASVFNTTIKKVITRQIVDGWVFDGRETDEENYSIFPNMLTYNSGVASEEWILLNRGITTYMNTENSTQNDYSRSANGISFTEECNQLMRETNIMELLTQEVDFGKIHKSVTLKSEYLFAYLGQLIGEETFRSFLSNWVSSHAHQVTDYDRFRQEIITAFNLDIDPIIKEVYFDQDQPSFIINNTEMYELLDGDRKRYQIKFDVKNTGSNDGVVKVNFNSDEDFSGSGFFRQRNEDAPTDDPGYLSLIKSEETKRFGFILDNKPSTFTINTLVSRNIPSIVTVFPGTFDLKEKAVPFEGEQIITEVKSATQYEVIVDNEDEGFSTFSPIKDTYLKAYLDKRNPSDQKYFGVWNRSYSKWLATTGSSFYGQYIRSAHFTRAGNGDKVCEWTPKLREAGFYDLYVYMIGKNQNQYNGNSRESRTYTYQYLINHSDGKDDISFNVTKAENGWNYLGSYYFSEEGGSVVLTDECDLRSVYADAVKWVKQ